MDPRRHGTMAKATQVGVALVATGVCLPGRRDLVSSVRPLLALFVEPAQAAIAAKYPMLRSMLIPIQAMKFTAQPSPRAATGLVAQIRPGSRLVAPQLAHR